MKLFRIAGKLIKTEHFFVNTETHKSYRLGSMSDPILLSLRPNNGDNEDYATATQLDNFPLPVFDKWPFSAADYAKHSVEYHQVAHSNTASEEHLLLAKAWNLSRS